MYQLILKTTDCVSIYCILYKFIIYIDQHWLIIPFHSDALLPEILINIPNKDNIRTKFSTGSSTCDLISITSQNSMIAFIEMREAI